MISVVCWFFNLSVKYKRPGARLHKAMPSDLIGGYLTFYLN
jgi:hypothetical protein